MDRPKFDSIIFDMDGTLWDAVDSYCLIWDKTLDECGFAMPPVQRSQLVGMMGLTIEKIIAVIAPEASGDKNFLRRLDENERSMMPQLGGRLYDGVADIIPQLAGRLPLFMVSNCSAYGLQNFMKFTGLAPYFTDSLTHGETLQSKDCNIIKLSQRNGLLQPLYVGDTLSDFRSCEKAGVDFAWAAYGFGDVPQAKFRLNRFADILDII